VEEILAVKNSPQPSADPQGGNLGGTTHLEKQIDELVFELYGLMKGKSL